MDTDPALPHFEMLSESDYALRINTPARSAEYYRRFHQPVIEAAKGSCDGNIVVVNVACGPAFELDFFGNDPRINVIGFDIAIDPLIEALRKRLPGGMFVRGDVSYPPVREGVADMAIALNAIIYKPWEMLCALKHVLKPGGKAVVNFRNFLNPKNAEFYIFQCRHNSTIYDSEICIEVDGRVEKFRLKVVDYSNSTDEKSRNLGHQRYFTSVDDMERFIGLSGLRIVRHETFNFSSPSNSNNEIDVYTLEKPVD